MKPLQNSIVWISAAILAVLPTVIAADFGGILRWTQFVASLAVVGVTALSCVAMFGRDNCTHPRQHVLLIPLLIWLAYAFFQTIPLPGSVVEFLSPGSHEAYTQWLLPILDSNLEPDKFPLSIAPFSSRHAAAVLSLLVAIVFASSMVFHARQRLIVLLIAFAMGAAIQSAFGLLRLALPETDFFDVRLDEAVGSFGTFINRNNAALFLNLGFGCSLGLLAWRLMALTGHEIDGDRFTIGELNCLIGDRESMIAIATAIVCGVGLVTCGSRGGIVAMGSGLLLAFGWIRQQRGLMTIPIAAGAMVFAAAILLVPLDMGLESIRRFDFSNSGSDTLASGGRFVHWADGWQAFLAHFPSGAGLSSYAFAYLPFQSGSYGSWAQHADNLWLEMIVEQGVVGVLLSISILALLVRSLNRLSHSPDPIDQGLRVTGWYVIGAVVASQFFDFGLVLPCNLFAVGVLFPAIITREVASGSEHRVVVSGSKKHPTTIAPQSPSLVAKKNVAFFLGHRFHQPIFVVTAVVVFTASVVASMELRRNAEVETLVKTTQHGIRAIRFDMEALAGLESRLVEASNDHADPELLSALADLKYRKGRLSEALARKPDSTEEFLRLYDESSAMKADLERQVPSQTEKYYQDALRLYSQSLKHLPLDPRAREGQLYLGCAGPNPTATLALLVQLKKLHSNKPEAMVLLGKYAANRGHSKLAASFWRSALAKNEFLTAKVLQTTLESGVVSVIDIMPERPEPIRIAARKMLDSSGKERDAFLEFAKDAVHCDRCNKRLEKSKCFSLRADIAYALGSVEEAVADDRLAIELMPTDIGLRLKLIHRLRAEQKTSEAIAEARKAKLLFRDAKQFDVQINQMRREDTLFQSELLETKKLRDVE
ncbi:MAG: O-antigen ligase family protein [Rubripirellula sp.]